MIWNPALGPRGEAWARTARIRQPTGYDPTAAGVDSGVTTNPFEHTVRSEIVDATMRMNRYSCRYDPIRLRRIVDALRCEGSGYGGQVRLRHIMGSLRRDRGVWSQPPLISPHD